MLTPRHGLAQSHRPLAGSATLAVGLRAMTLALGVLKILDLSRQLPGPFCSMLLADLGADVLCIANPDDPMGVGIPFLALNKRHMTLNLKHSAGRDIFLRLAAA